MKVPLFLAILMVISPAHAFFEKGGVTGLGARPLGMGGAFTAVSDENSAVFWNPGGLGQLTRAELSGMYAAIHNGKVFYLFSSASWPLLDQGIMAFSWERRDYTNSTGQEKEDVYYVTVSSSLTESRTFFAGINLKFLKLSAPGFEGVGGQGLGVDWGVLYRLPLPRYGKEVRLGFSATDLNTKFHQTGAGVQEIPSVIRVGMAYQFERWISLAMDLEHMKDPSLGNPTENKVRAGVEGWFFDGTLGFRLGFVGFATVPGRYSMGTSYRARDWEVDYAYLGHSGGLGDNHRATFALRFGRAVSVGIRPAPPLGLQAVAKSGEVELAWSPNQEPSVGGYNIYVSTAPGGEYRKVNTVGLSSARVIGLENNRTYYFVVAALNNTQPPLESEMSAEIPATPKAPEMKAVELGAQVQEGELTVSWRPIPEVAGYNIYISTGPGGGHVRYNAQPLSSTKVRMVQVGGKGVEAGERYYIYVRSVSKSDPPVEGPPSVEQMFIAVPRL